MLELYFGGPPDGPLRRAYAAMKAASALREGLWALVSARHLATPGADYAAHAATYLDRAWALVAALD